MQVREELLERSGAQCELCKSTEGLTEYEVAPQDALVVTCSTCFGQLSGDETPNPNHWRCLNDSMWSEVPAVQVIAYRMLNQLRSEGWPQDLLDMMYLDEDTLKWAKSGLSDSEADTVVHKDSNGAILENGDTVVLIKDLNVKGANFTAKRGTAVRNISLVHDNAEQLEGRVNGQQIVILTQFVKKS